MKKIILALGIAAASIAGFSSCNGGSNPAEGQDKAFNDSLAQAFGTFFGNQLSGQLTSLKYQLGDKFNEDEFIRGIETVMKADTANISYLIGISAGLQPMFQINQWNSLPANIDPAIVRSAMVKALKDTTANVQESYMAFQVLSSELQQKAEAARNKDAIAANEEAAKKFVEELQAKDSEVKATESGLVYKIENPGEGEKVGDNAKVQVKYVGKHLNGEEFDSSKGEAVSFNVQGVVPGFREGLQLLGKGGKATLYIPGNLAYGANGQPQAGIGPNEMLVFDVEVVDINPAE